jgi:hypothetical protein
MTARAPLALGAALLLAAAAQAASRLYAVPEGRFECAVPAGWSVSRDAARDAVHKVYGVVFTAGEGREGAASITVEYYAPDNGVFESTSAFVDAFSSVEGGGPGPRVRDAELAGRPARTFTRERTRAVRPVSELRTVRVHEEVWVAPAEGGGFHAAVLSAPAGSREKSSKAFRRLLKSLRISAPPK